MNVKNPNEVDDKEDGVKGGMGDAAWVDEEGRIVRIDEGTYSQQHEIGDGDHKISFGTDVYSPALKDWIAKGPESVHVQSAETVTGNIRQ